MLRYLLIVIIIFSSCSTSTEGEKDNVFEITEFPNNIGNRWDYFQKSLKGENIGSLSYNIVSDSIINDKSFRIWEIISHSDSLSLGLKSYRYIISDNNSVTFFNQLDTEYFEESVFEFPFFKNKRWQNSYNRFDNFVSQDYHITDIKHVELDKYSFNSCFRLVQKTTIKDSIDDPNPFLTNISEKWIVPNVGIVKMKSELILTITSVEESKPDTISAYFELNNYLKM